MFDNNICSKSVNLHFYIGFYFYLLTYKIKKHTPSMVNTKLIQGVSSCCIVIATLLKINLQWLIIHGKFTGSKAAELLPFR